MPIMKTNKSALAFIFITVLVDVIGIGIIIPIIPDLITELTGEGTQRAIIYGMWLTTAYAGMQFLFAPVLGEISDAYGRRPILLMALFGLTVDYLIHAWAFLAGIMGASFTVATAYIADISTKENKAQNFGLIGAAFGIGFIIGPGIGGYFGEMDVRLPFYIAAGLTFLNFLFGFFLVPESLAPENRRPMEKKKMIAGVSLLSLKKYKGVLLLIFAFFLAQLAGQVLPAVWPYYGIERYDWSLYLFLIPYALGGIAGPTVQGVISNQVSEKEQGNLQGAITGLTSLTAIFGQLIFAPVFYHFIRPESKIYFPGAAYALAAILLLIAFLFALKAMSNMDIQDA